MNCIKRDAIQIQTVKPGRRKCDPDSSSFLIKKEVPIKPFETS